MINIPSRNAINIALSLIVIFFSFLPVALIAESPIEPDPGSEVPIDSSSSPVPSPEDSTDPSANPDTTDVNSTDQLFDQSQDQVVTGTEKVDISPILTSAKPSAGGSVSLKGGISGGWSTVPDLGNLAIGFDKEVGYSISLSGTFDARPDKSFHVFGSVSASFPTGLSTTKSSNNLLDAFSDNIYTGTGGITSMTWSSITIGEVYVDYTLLDTVFFRIGKVAMGWGQARVFGGSGNFVSGSSTGASFKASVPLFTGLFEAVALAEPDFFATALKPLATEFGVAGQYTISLGPVSMGLSGFYQKYAGPKADYFIKTSLFGIDLFSETTVNFFGVVSPTKAEPVIGDPIIDEIAGFFWEGLTPKLQIQGEYAFNSHTADGRDQSLSLGVGLKEIPGIPFKFGINWIHTFFDQSGYVAFGFDTPLVDHLSLSAIITGTYGPTGGRYTSKTLSFAIGFTLSGSY